MEWLYVFLNHLLKTSNELSFDTGHLCCLSLSPIVFPSPIGKYNANSKFFKQNPESNNLRKTVTIIFTLFQSISSQYF